MASKRKLETDDTDDFQEIHVSNKKHTLDSDEEDSDEYEKEDLNESDIEGVEEGEANVRDEVKITPFNMREELEEGHFDKEGHYHWNKDAEVKDNWLDNIDWVKIKSKDNSKVNADEESNDSTKLPDAFNEVQTYAKVLDFMNSNETIQKTLQRLGKNRAKISSTERLRRKKLGLVDEAAEKITQFTELVNEILTRTGNMDIYQETYAQIKTKVNNSPSTSKGTMSAGSTSASDTFDMYSDDFVEKEKNLLETHKQKEKPIHANDVASKPTPELCWEFKWKQNDIDLQGPYSTEQMLKWSQQKYFKEGVYVRKIGDIGNFYSSNRIDFDLYL